MGTITVKSVVDSGTDRRKCRDAILTALVEAHDCGYYGVQWDMLKGLCGFNEQVYQTSLEDLVLAGVIVKYETESKECTPVVKRVICLWNGDNYVGYEFDESEILS